MVPKMLLEPPCPNGAIKFPPLLQSLELPGFPVEFCCAYIKPPMNKALINIVIFLLTLFLFFRVFVNMLYFIVIKFSPYHLNKTINFFFFCCYDVIIGAFCNLFSLKRLTIPKSVSTFEK